MNITLKRTDEQVELIKAMASRNRDVAYAAQVALAEFIGPVLAEVINNAPTISNLFTPLQYNSDDNPSIPLDLITTFLTRIISKFTVSLWPVVFLLTMCSQPLPS